MNFLLLFNRNNKIILMNDKSRNKYVITIIIILRHVINLLLSLLLLLFLLLLSICINRNTSTRDFDKFGNVHVNFCPCFFLSEKLHITHGCSKFFAHSHVFSGNHCTVLFRIIDRRSNTILRGERKWMTRKYRNAISLRVLLDLFTLIYKRYAYDPYVFTLPLAD